jgi:hypothetical protein
VVLIALEKRNNTKPELKKIILGNAKLSSGFLEALHIFRTTVKEQ